MLADSGMMSLLKNYLTDLESLGTKDFHYPTHQLTLFRASHVGYQRPHRWLSSGLHASLTTFGAGDRQGKAQWMRMPGTWKFCESYLPYLLGYVWGSWFQKQDDDVKCLLLEVRKSSPCKKYLGT